MFSKSETDKVYFTVSAKETNGEYSILEGEVYSGTGPPMHYHKIITQTITVKEGALHLNVGGEMHILKPGDTYVIPPMVPHKEGGERGKLMRCTVEIRPGHQGYEDFMNMTYGPDNGNLGDEEKRQIYLNADTYGA